MHALCDLTPFFLKVADTASGYTRTLTYDTLGRLSETATTPGTGADTYYEKQTYDAYGRPHQ